MAATLLDRVLGEVRSSTYVSRLGITLDEVSGGRAQARSRAAHARVNRAGIVHGGATTTAMLAAAEVAAATTQRDGDERSLRIATASVSFVDAVPASAEIAAIAHVVRRGRDIVHVVADARADGLTVAHAALVYVVADPDLVPVCILRSRAASGTLTGHERLSASPYMDAAGAAVLETDGEWTCISLPWQGNEAADRRVHDGAVVGLVDTCAAIAAFKSCREHAGGPSATVSLSLSWSAAIVGEARAGARVIGRTGSLFSTETEVWGDDGFVRACGHIVYRIVGATA